MSPEPVAARRKKLTFPELKRAVVEQRRLFHPEVILIEDKASGTQLIQDLIEAGLSRDESFWQARSASSAGPGSIHLPKTAKRK